jgi:hypothetical protein
MNLLQNFITFTTRHRRAVLALTGLYYVLVLALHEPLSKVSVWLQEKLTIKTYNSAVTVLIALAGIMTASYLIRILLRHEDRKKKAAYLVFTGLLLFLTYRNFLVVNVESIHFLQYAILAAPLYALTGSYGQSIFWVTLLGAIDEAYQYFFLYPDWKYLDFNDIVLNLLGGACLLVIVFISEKPGDRVIRRRSLLTPPMPLIIFILLILLIIPFLTGIAGSYPAEGVEDPPVLLSRQPPPEDFWQEMKWGKKYHVLSPVEGTVMTAILIGAYSLLDIGRRRDEDPG